MFDTLSDRLGGIFDKLTKRGALNEEQVSEAMREVRVAMLEADVALPVVKDFVARVKDQAVGEKVLKSIQPGQMVVKIVHDELVATLSGGEETAPGLNLKGTPPTPILMVGLQGSGKTTTSAKIALFLKNKQKKKVLLASLDVYRPAAQQQLQVLAQQTETICLDPILGEQPVAIAKRAMETGRKQGYDVVILDTAGRVTIDNALMDEVAQVRDAVNPTETLLVTDAMTGQDAVTTAKEFHDKVGITGIALTRVDGDARGGAALSMRTVSGAPIKIMGTGEKPDQLEAFDARRIADRILGMGDVVGLVEKAQELAEQEDAEAMAKRAMKGEFTLADMEAQLTQIRGMGDIKGLLGMIPGVAKMKNQMAEANVDDKAIGRQQAIIRSMTPKERLNPKLINGQRRKRIADGSGTSVSEVNRLLKQFQQMSKMMKKMGKLGKKGLMRGGMGALMGGGMPPGGFPPR